MPRSSLDPRRGGTRHRRDAADDHGGVPSTSCCSAVDLFPTTPADHEQELEDRRCHHDQGRQGKRGVSRRPGRSPPSPPRRNRRFRGLRAPDVAPGAGLEEDQRKAQRRRPHRRCSRRSRGPEPGACRRPRRPSAAGAHGGLRRAERRQRDPEDDTTPAGTPARRLWSRPPPRAAGVALGDERAAHHQHRADRLQHGEDLVQRQHRPHHRDDNLQLNDQL